MAKKVSMDIIAKSLGVSKNTVSLAMRGMPGISEQTRKLITDTADEMGYEYKFQNKDCAQTKNLCLVIPKSARDSIGFFSFVQLGIEEEARKNNINTIIHYYDENDQNFETPNCIKDKMISGIITLGRVSKRTASTIISYNLPFVMVDNYIDNIVTNCVLTDNQCGGYMATEYLISCGHRNIGFLGDISVAVSFYDRYQGYLKAMREYDIPLGNTCLIANISDVVENYEKLITRNKAEALDKLPRAFVCCNDQEAITACKAFKNVGILIPEDISIIGFDDIEFSRDFTPELTTMSVQKELMGKMAVRKLISKVGKNSADVEKTLLPTSIVVRQSVKKVDV